LIFPGGATGELDLIRLFPVVGMKQEPTVNNFGKRLWLSSGKQGQQVELQGSQHLHVGEGVHHARPPTENPEDPAGLCVKFR